MRTGSTGNRMLGALLMAFFVALAGTAWVAAPALADEELAAERAYWQGKYRVLRKNKAILEDNIAKLEHNYAQAQRRNYPRGGAREAFRTKANEQRKMLAEVESELATIFEEARAANVPPGWLFEVEDEPIELSQPAAVEGAEEDDRDREGRNPLYADDDD